MRTALVIFILLFLGAVGLLIWQHQQGSAPSSGGQPPTPPPVAPVEPSRPENEETRAAQAVISYLRAIYKSDYRQAYGLLSAPSRRKHSYEDFRADCQQGATDFELSSVPEVTRKDGTIAVTLSLAEEPGTHSFLAVPEGKEWKVVYLSGQPSFPYP